MSKKSKLWIVAAILLILIGNIMFCIVMNKVEWDFAKLSTTNFETNEYSINENFKNIKVITDTADIEFAPSPNSTSSVVCDEQTTAKHSITVENASLVIEVKNLREWYEYIGIFSKTPKLTIFLPENAYDKLSINAATGSVNIPQNFQFKSMDVSTHTGNIKNYASTHDNAMLKTSAGSILFKNASANTIELSTATGKIDVANANCQSDLKITVSTGHTNITNTKSKNIISEGTTGSIFLEDVLASEKLFIKRSTGSVNFKNCDANDTVINTSTGSVKGNFLTDKTFLAQSSTGNIDVPETFSNEKCQVTTSTGGIKITVNQATDSK